LTRAAAAVDRCDPPRAPGDLRRCLRPAIYLSGGDIRGAKEVPRQRHGSTSFVALAGSVIAAHQRGTRWTPPESPLAGTGLL